MKNAGRSYTLVLWTNISCFYISNNPNSHCSLPHWVTLPVRAVFILSHTAENLWPGVSKLMGNSEFRSRYVRLQHCVLNFSILSLSSFHWVFWFNSKFIVLTSLKKLNSQRVYKSQVWWCTPVIAALGTWRQKDWEEFKAILIYIVS